MPFVTPFSGLELNDDIKYERRDPYTGATVQVDNNLKSIKLAYGDRCDFHQESPTYKEYIIRGTPNPTKLCWEGDIMAVFRIVSHKFGQGEWERFMALYERNIKQSTRMLYYEPDIDDITASNDPDRQWHFPTWVLKRLKDIGEFENGLVASKVGLSEKMLTKQRYDFLMKELGKRLAENSEVEDNADRDEKPTGKDKKVLSGNVS